MKSSFVQPYLIFGGRCDEALEFYRSAMGAQVDLLMRYNESPQPMPPGSIPAGFEKKVMHTTFRIGRSIVMASDGDDETVRFSGISLSLTCENELEAKQVFGRLAEGGEVTLPICKTFWSPCFGMLKDRFGLGWMITVAASQST